MAQCDLVTELKHRHGPETARAVENIFAALALPVPDGDEFYDNDQQGRDLVFLNDYGCVLYALDAEKYPLIDHPRLLQPLMSRMAGKVRIDIYPGGTGMVGDDKTALRLIGKLERDGIEFWDHYGHNCVRLPPVNGAINKGTVVVIDGASRPEGVPTVKDSFADRAARHPSRAGTKSPQEVLFDPLRDLFNEAWPEDQDAPDPQKMKLFWNKCREMKEAGLLVAGWTDTGNNDLAHRMHRRKHELNTGESYSAHLHRMPEISAP